MLLGGASAAAGQLSSAAAPAAAASAVNTELQPAHVPETVELGRSGQHFLTLHWHLQSSLPYISGPVKPLRSMSCQMLAPAARNDAQ